MMKMDQMIRDIKPEEFQLFPLTENSNYAIPIRMEYTKDNKQVVCDMVQSFHSVSVLIFNRTRNVFICVKQFRPSVFYQGNKSADGFQLDLSKAKPEDGITLEFCAGNHDKEGSTPAEIAKQEALEECGYDIPIENFELISTFRNNVSLIGEKEYLYYVEVTDEMKVSEGGGNIEEGEFIQVVEMSIPEAKAYISQKDVQSEAGLLLGISWFLLHKNT